MKKTGKRFDFLFALGLLLLSLPMAASADMRFSATVDRNQVGVGGHVTLKLILSTDDNSNTDEEPRLPNLDGFDLLNKWSQSESSSIFENGKFKFERKTIYNYTLSPQKTGKLTIGEATIRINGKSLTSKPIVIAVSDALPGAPKSNVAQDDEEQNVPPFSDDGEDDLFTQLLKRRGLGVPGSRGGGGGTKPPPSIQSPDVSDRDLFFISVETNKKKAFVGEEIIANWYLYVRGNLQGFDALKYPDLKGFWKEDLEMATKLNFTQEIINGLPYSKALLVSYALFPISAGSKVLDAYQAKGTILRMDSPMAMFGLGQPQNVTKSSKEIPIDVVPLPTAGRPANFTGAVGHFNVAGSLSATQVKANQPVSLKVRFTGEGNVKAIELPQLEWPKNLELYDTKKESKFQKSGEGYKEFELLLIPRSEGDVAIPPIVVSYFDPKTQKYVTTQTPAFSLKVLPGDPSTAAPSVPLAKTDAQPEKANTPDIKYLKTSSLFGLPATEAKLLWLIAFAALYLAFGIQMARAWFGRGDNNSSEIKKRVKRKLEMARGLLKKQDWRGVGVECSNAVLSTLGEVAGGGGSVPAEDLLLKLPKGQEKLQENLRKFLSRSEIVSFAPQEMASSFNQGEVKKLINEAEEIIGNLLEVNQSSV